MATLDAAREGAEREWDARMKTVWFEMRRRAREKLAGYTREDLRTAAHVSDALYEKLRLRTNALPYEAVGRTGGASDAWQAFIQSLLALALSLEARTLLSGTDPTSRWDPARQSFEDMLRLLAEARSA